jgi:hypothetical protein
VNHIVVRATTTRAGKIQTSLEHLIVVELRVFK